MKFTPVKLAQIGAKVARTIAGAAASMTPIATESASQLDHVWDLLNMLPDDVTRKALEDDLEVENIHDFQLITQAELDDLPKGTLRRV